MKWEIHSFIHWKKLKGNGKWEYELEMGSGKLKMPIGKWKENGKYVQTAIK